VIDEGKQHTETIVVLHGYPSCSYDYYRVLPIWTKTHRVVIHDHPGFGLSNKPLNYSYSLFEQADVAIALWRKLGIQKVHLVAHGYGTSVATELIARKNLGYEPVTIQSISMGNGSMLIEMADLIWTQKLLRHKTWGPILAQLSSQALFINNFNRLWYDKSKIDRHEFEVLWKMLIHNDGKKTLPLVSQYLHERKRFWHRWIGHLEKTNQPIHLIWADQDPVAVFEMARVLAQKIPNNTLTILPNLGHYPMLEGFKTYADAVLKGIKK